MTRWSHERSHMPTSFGVRLKSSLPSRSVSLAFSFSLPLALGHSLLGILRCVRACVRSQPWMRFVIQIEGIVISTRARLCFSRPRKPSHLVPPLGTPSSSPPTLSPHFGFFRTSSYGSPLPFSEFFIGLPSGLKLSLTFTSVGLKELRKSGRACAWRFLLNSYSWFWSDFNENLLNDDVYLINLQLFFNVTILSTLNAFH